MQIQFESIDSVIQRIIDIKHSGMFDYTRPIMCFGELHFYSGESKSRTEDNIDDILDNNEVKETARDV